MQTTDHTKLLEDMLGFIKHTFNREDLNDSQMLGMIVGTLGHDINGVLGGDEFVVPRVTGYSKRA